MKIHSQDRAVYFSGVPRSDWPPAVDARPPAQPEESSVGVSSESGGMDAGRMESPPPVSEKIQGKRPAEDEPAQKKRKIGAAAPYKPGDISLGDDQTNQTRRNTVFDWSDDDKVLTAPPPRMDKPPHSTRAGDQSGGGKEVREPPTSKVPEQRADVVSAQQMMEVLAGRTTEVPEQQAEAIPE